MRNSPALGFLSLLVLAALVGCEDKNHDGKPDENFKTSGKAEQAAREADKATAEGQKVLSGAGEALKDGAKKVGDEIEKLVDGGATADSPPAKKR